MITFLEYVTYSKLKEIEKVLDKAFKKFDIDFDFTKHFADRMDDPRNKPKITLKELGELFQKIYKQRGRNLKARKDLEAVIKDITTDINIPVAIEYDKKKDEFRVALKTIMRKKKFKTPDKVIKYE